MKQIRDLSRPSDLTKVNLKMTSEQKKIFDNFLVDATSTKDPYEGITIMKYWFLRAWEAAEKQGDDERRILNEWRSKKTSILQKKAQMSTEIISTEEDDGFKPAEKSCHCPICKGLIVPYWNNVLKEYQCQNCSNHWGESEYPINWIEGVADEEPNL